MEISTKFNIGDKVYTLVNGRPVAGKITNINLTAENKFNYEITVINSKLVVNKTETEIGVPEDDELDAEHGD